MNTISTTNAELDRDANEVVELFQRKTKLTKIPFELKRRGDNPYLIFEVLNPSERLFSILNDVTDSLSEGNSLRESVTIKRRSHPPANRLLLPETSLLQTVIAESLTVSSSTFGSEFLDRYIRSVFGAEEQVTAKSNNIVLGRRGSGKSSLLLYAMHKLKPDRIPSCWVSMQTYEGRADFGVISDVFLEFLSQLLFVHPSTEISALVETVQLLENGASAEASFDQLVPKIKRALAPIAQRFGSIVVFLDDIHVLAPSLQPRLLSKLYSIARDNQIYLKVSGIEQLTESWDPSTRKGLETPHDAQQIKLDYNLTMPDKSFMHIESILDAHAKYCGLPSIGYICGDGVIQRLVWVAAGVPRDALSIFSTAISRATLRDQKRVSISSVNEAASTTAGGKLTDISRDASGRQKQIESVFEVVRNFCVSTEKRNAFLVEVGKSTPAIELLKELIGLRLLHVLHEGVTPHEAGRRYMALMLDYGFYVGIRAARSVDLFQSEPKQIAAKDLRSLPILPLSLVENASSSQS